MDKNTQKDLGAFYTPRFVVDKCYQKLAETLGENWQTEYTIYDCAAGDGALVMQIEDKSKVFVSDIYEPSVELLRKSFGDNAFQFDFISDDTQLLPDTIKNCDRDKLLFLINPPYEKDKTLKFLGKIWNEFNGCRIACISKLDIITGTKTHIEKFRQEHNLNLIDGFVFRSKAFKDLKGDFPIGFFIWEATWYEKYYGNFECYDSDGKELKYLCNKIFPNWILQK